MSDASRTPEAPATRPARHATSPDDVFTTLARRVKLPTVPDAGAPQVLRAASVPLVAAALVAAGTGAASATTTTSAPSTGSAPGSRSQASPRVAHAQVTYTVKEGDTVAAISARAGVAVRTILEANHLPASGLIRPGQRLVLPGVKAPAAAPAKAAPAKGRTAPAKATAAPKPATRPAPKPAAVVVHVVKPGDTVSAISARYRISIAAILQANQLGVQGLIHPGQKLRLPGVKPAAAAAKPAAPATHPYTVKAGDTLNDICAKEKVSLTAVISLNKIANAGLIHPGQRLLLPGAPKSSVPNTFLGRRYPDAVAQAAALNRATLAKRDLPTRAQMKNLVADTARSMGVDPSLALAIAWQESGFNPRVVSPANAIGTMQVIPGTGRWASDLVGRKLDLLVPRDNATAGVAVLAALLAQAEEDQAIAGYYQGLGSVRSRGMYEDTKSYVASVKAHRARFAKELAGG